MSKIVKRAVWGFILSVLLILLIDSYVSYSQNPFCYNKMSKTPVNHVGLLLGTSKKVRGGNLNLYYKYRIQAAADLYNNKKISKIICSGDNGTKFYNEPREMKKDLMNLGIKESDIFLDYAGFRTLDSVMRAKAIFGQNRFTIISQPFHNQRALFIARKKGINAIAFNARKVSNRSKYKLMIREKLARVKMVYDLITNKKPKYLGESISIPY